MSLPAKCKAGHCTACGRLVWRTAQAARSDVKSGIRAGQEFLLWPAPESVYAAVQTETGHAPGIAFCPSCAPAPGQPALEGYGPVLHLEGARSRYAHWYSEPMGVFFRTWLVDALSLPSGQVIELMAQWAKDSRG